MSKSFLLLALLVVVSETQRPAAPQPRASQHGSGVTATADAGAHKHGHCG